MTLNPREEEEDLVAVEEPKPRVRDNSKEGKAMRALLLAQLERISAHRNGSVFEKPVRKVSPTVTPICTSGMGVA